MKRRDAHNHYLEHFLSSKQATPLSGASARRMKDVMLLHFDQEFVQPRKFSILKNLGISLLGTLSMAVFVFMVLRNNAPLDSQDSELNSIEMELAQFTIPEEDFSLDL